MIVELSQADAEILIAVLLYAEGMARLDNPPILAAIVDLAAFRSALIQTYITQRFLPAAQQVTP